MHLGLASACTISITNDNLLIGAPLKGIGSGRLLRTYPKTCFCVIKHKQHSFYSTAPFHEQIERIGWIIKGLLVSFHPASLPSISPLTTSKLPPNPRRDRHSRIGNQWSLERLLVWLMDWTEVHTPLPYKKNKKHLDCTMDCFVFHFSLSWRFPWNLKLLAHVPQISAFSGPFSSTEQRRRLCNHLFHTIWLIVHQHHFQSHRVQMQIEWYPNQRVVESYQLGWSSIERQIRLRVAIIWMASTWYQRCFHQLPYLWWRKRECSDVHAGQNLTSHNSLVNESG